MVQQNQVRRELLPHWRVIRDATKKDQVDSPAVTSLAYDRMSLYWELTTDLRSTDAMRDAGRDRLPANDAEDPVVFNNRLGRSFLFGFYHDTVRKHANKPFSKQVSVQGEVPLEVELILDDVDMRGTDLTRFARQAFSIAYDRGVVHALTDFPSTTFSSRAQEQAAGVRPFWRLVPPENLIAWRFREMPSGRMQLVHVRILETATERIGMFGEAEVDRIRVIDAPSLLPEEVAASNVDGAFDLLGDDVRSALTTGTFQVWRRVPMESSGGTKTARVPVVPGADADVGQEQLTRRGDWVIEEEGTHTFPGVPLRTFVDPNSQQGPMEAEPPQWRLAELNLEHWQKKSDRDHLGHVAMVPILHETGVTDEEKDRPLRIGAGKAIRRTKGPQDTSLRYVEHTGSALGWGDGEVERIELRAEVVAMAALVQRPGTRTATEVSSNDDVKLSPLQAAAVDFGPFLMELVEDSVTWLNTAPNSVGRLLLPEDFSISLFSEFSIQEDAAVKATKLLEARVKREITRETFLNEWQRLGMFSDQIDVREELRDLDADEEERRTAMQSLLSGDSPEGEAGGDDDDDDADDRNDDDQQSRPAGDDRGEAA